MWFVPNCWNFRREWLSVPSTIAAQNSHDVWRLPPYQCEFNTTVCLWGIVKGHVAIRNKWVYFSTCWTAFARGTGTSNPTNVGKLLHSCWVCEDETSKQDAIIDSQIELFIFNSGGSTDISGESSSALRDIEQLPQVLFSFLVWKSLAVVRSVVLHVAGK